MMNVFFRVQKRCLKKSPRKQGYVLLVTFLLSGFILTLGLGLAHVITQEIQFSADLLWGEKSYFAAESGVEYALLDLKTQPVSFVQSEMILSSNDVSFFLENGNQVKEYQKTLQPLEALQFRLQKDIDITKESDIEFGIPNSISVSQMAFWELQCQNAAEVQALSGNIESQRSVLIREMESENTAPPQKISDFLENLDEDAMCFLTLENLSDTNIIDIVLQSHEEDSDQFTPPIATVKSRGVAGGREKIIQFEYAQKNLTRLFRFGFLNQN